MNPIETPPLVAGTLTFSKHPVRYVIIGGELWFAASDIFTACNVSVTAEPFEHFAEEHHALHLFPGQDGEELCAAVSYLGALTLGADAFHPVDRIWGNWLRKQARVLLAPPGGEPPLLPPALLADGRLPPSPGGKSSFHLDWLQLKWAGGYYVHDRFRGRFFLTGRG